MVEWFANGVTIDRLLAAEVAAFVVLLAILRVRRWVLQRYRHRLERRPRIEIQPDAAEAIDTAQIGSQSAAVTARDVAREVTSRGDRASEPRQGNAVLADGTVGPGYWSGIVSSSEGEPIRSGNALALADDRSMPPMESKSAVILWPKLRAFGAREAIATAADGAITPPVEPLNVARRRPRPARELEETELSPRALLDCAHAELAQGSREAAAMHLRQCVRLAHKLKETRIEAEARLELGDLARASSDLTSACEQWQLARSLFGQLDRTNEALAAQQRMERAACPTDWVLNEF